MLDLAADLVSEEDKEDHGADEEEGHQGEEDDVTFTEGILGQSPVIHSPAVPYHRVQSSVIVSRTRGF